MIEPIEDGFYWQRYEGGVLVEEGHHNGSVTITGATRVESKIHKLTSRIDWKAAEAKRREAEHE